MENKVNTDQGTATEERQPNITPAGRKLMGDLLFKSFKEDLVNFYPDNRSFMGRNFDYIAVKERYYMIAPGYYAIELMIMEGVNLLPNGKKQVTDNDAFPLTSLTHMFTDEELAIIFGVKPRETVSSSLINSYYNPLFTKILREDVAKRLVLDNSAPHVIIEDDGINYDTYSPTKVLKPLTEKLTARLGEYFAGLYQALQEENLGDNIYYLSAPELKVSYGTDNDLVVGLNTKVQYADKAGRLNNRVIPVSLDSVTQDAEYAQSLKEYGDLVYKTVARTVQSYLKENSNLTVGGYQFTFAPIPSNLTGLRLKDPKMDEAIFQRLVVALQNPTIKMSVKKVEDQDHLLAINILDANNQMVSLLAGSNGVCQDTPAGLVPLYLHDSNDPKIGTLTSGKANLAKVFPKSLVPVILMTAYDRRKKQQVKGGEN